MFDLSTLKYNTDWTDAITRNGMVQNYNVSISGGTDNTTYYFSANQFGDKGILKGNDFNRTLLRNSNIYKLGKYIKLGHTLNLSFAKNNLKPNEFADAYRIGSTAPVRDDKGNYGYVSGLSVANPVAALDYTHHFTNDTRLQGNLFVDITPLSGLTIHNSFNFNNAVRKETNYVPKYYVSSVQQTSNSTLSIANRDSTYYIIDNNANYTRKIFEKHGRPLIDREQNMVSVSTGARTPPRRVTAPSKTNTHTAESGTPAPRLTASIRDAIKSMATSAMAKARPAHLATGENAVIVCCRTADVVIGPIGVVIADSMEL